MKRAVLLLAGLSVLASGCIEGDLDPKSIINRWRVLAIEADRPEARPGMDVHFDPLVVTPEGEHAVHGEDGVRFDWVVCVRMERAAGLGGVQYSPEDPSEACAAADTSLDLTAAGDGSATLPGEITDALWPDPEAVASSATEVFGDQVTPELIARLLSTVGIIVTVQLTVLDRGEQVVRAYKRITLVDRDELGTNPPEPRYQIGEQWISGRDVDEAWTCLPEDGEMPVVEPDAKVILSPDTDDEGWRDSYFVLDITGAITEVSERPFYSFLSTDGAFDQETTRAPVRQEIWRSPADPGIYPLWLVVRDGHGGMTACRTQVEVR